MTGRSDNLFPLSDLIDQVKAELATAMKKTLNAESEARMSIQSVEIEASVVLLREDGQRGEGSIGVPKVLALGFGANMKESVQHVHKVKITFSDTKLNVGTDDRNGAAAYAEVPVSGLGSDPSKYREQ